MVRLPLSPYEICRGVALGALLRDARGNRTVREVAAGAGLAEETLRKIERGAVPTPSLFTIAALTGVLGLELGHLVRDAREHVLQASGLDHSGT